MDQTDEHSWAVRFGVRCELGMNLTAQPSTEEALMCQSTSPGGRLVCANPRCDGRGHVWVHESSAPDRKRDDDGTMRSAA